MVSSRARKLLSLSFIKDGCGASWCSEITNCKSLINCFTRSPKKLPCCMVDIFWTLISFFIFYFFLRDNSRCWCFKPPSWVRHCEIAGSPQPLQEAPTPNGRWTFGVALHKFCSLFASPKTHWRQRKLIGQNRCSLLKGRLPIRSRVAC